MQNCPKSFLNLSLTLLDTSRIKVGWRLKPTLWTFWNYSKTCNIAVTSLEFCDMQRGVSPLFVATILQGLDNFFSKFWLKSWSCLIESGPVCIVMLGEANNIIFRFPTVAVLNYLPIEPESRILASMSLSLLVQEIAWRQVGANPFLAPMLNSHWEKAKKEQSRVKYLSNCTHLIEENWNEMVVCVLKAESTN